MATLSIIEGNSNMVFASWALVIATIVLAFITFFYMSHTKRLADDTKRMADIMAQEFELKIAPIIQIEKRDGSFQENFGLLNFEIINKGSLPSHIAKIVLEWWYEEVPDKIHRKKVIIDKVLGGGEPREFKLPFFKDEMIKGGFEESKNRSFDMLMALAKGKIYAIHKDRNGNQHKTRDFPLEGLIDTF